MKGLPLTFGLTATALFACAWLALSGFCLAFHSAEAFYALGSIAAPVSLLADPVANWVSGMIHLGSLAQVTVELLALLVCGAAQYFVAGAIAGFVVEMPRKAINTVASQRRMPLHH